MRATPSSQHTKRLFHSNSLWNFLWLAFGITHLTLFLHAWFFFFISFVGLDSFFWLLNVADVAYIKQTNSTECLCFLLHWLLWWPHLLWWVQNHFHTDDLSISLQPRMLLCLREWPIHASSFSGSKPWLLLHPTPHPSPNPIGCFFQIDAEIEAGAQTSAGVLA